MFIVILTYFQEASRSVPRVHIKYGVGLSVAKVNDSPLSFVAESSFLDFLLVLDASLGISCVCMCFMIGVNDLFIKFVNAT